MVTTLILLLTFLNFILITGIIIYYFKTHYTIIDRESWDTITEYIQEQQSETTEEPVELVGGTGFFKEYIEDEDYENE